MTKVELLDNILGDDLSGFTPYQYKKVLEAMDEYAKLYLIQFAKTLGGIYDETFCIKTAKKYINDEE